MKKIIIISIALLALTACESKQVEESRRVLTNHTPLKNCSRLTVSRFIVSVTMTVTFTSQTERAMFNTVIKRGLEKQQKNVKVQTMCNNNGQENKH